MKNWLPYPSKNPVTTLLKHAFTRRINPQNSRLLGPAALTIYVSGTVLVLAYTISRQMFQQITIFTDTHVLLQTFSAVSIGTAIVSLALVHYCVPLVLQSAPRFITALPITKSQWIMPQLIHYYLITFAILASLWIGIEASGLLVLPQKSGQQFFQIISLFCLIIGIGVGFALNVLATRNSYAHLIINSSYATGLLTTLLAFRPRTTVLVDYALTTNLLKFGAHLFIVTVAVIIGLYLIIRIAARTVLAQPLQPSIPRSGRLANPATSRGFMPPLYRATIRGLAADFQSWFFLASMLLVAAASISVAYKLSDSIFTSAVVTNNAIIIPLGFAAWFAFARQKLGSQRSTIYKKPIPSHSLLALQSVPLVSLAVAVSTICTITACRILGVAFQLQEIVRLALLSGSLSLVGYASGIIAYPTRGEHTSVLRTLLVLFAGAAAVSSLDQTLRNHSLLVHSASHVTILFILAVLCLAFERLSQKGLRI